MSTALRSPAVSGADADRAGVVRRLGRARLKAVIAVGLVRGTTRWCLRPGVRREARERATLLLAGTTRAGDARRVARAQVVEQGVQWMLAKHFADARDIPIRGLEHLVDVLGEGRGALLATAHYGWIHGLIWRFALEGFPYAAVSGGWIQHSSTPYDVRHKPLLAATAEAGARHILAGTGAFDQLSAVVENGRLAGMAIDMPGSLPMTWFGKPTRLGQATFRISHATGAPVVPFAMRRTRLRLWVEVFAPLRPSGSLEEHAERVARRIEADALAHAEHYLPKTIITLWPGGDGDAALPNRDHWQQKLATGT